MRWTKPLDAEPGHWKKQLPGKLLRLASHGDTASVDAMLDAGTYSIDHRGSHGRTVLFEAVRRGRTETATRLLERGADPNLRGGLEK